MTAKKPQRKNSADEAKSPAASSSPAKPPAAKAPPAKAAPPKAAPPKAKPPAAKAPPSKPAPSAAKAPPPKKRRDAEPAPPAAKGPPPKKKRPSAPAPAELGDLSDAAALSESADPLAPDPLEVNSENAPPPESPAEPAEPSDASPKKAPNWILIGGIAGGVLAAMLFAACGGAVAVWWLSSDDDLDQVVLDDDTKQPQPAETPAEVGTVAEEPADVGTLAEEPADVGTPASEEEPMGEPKGEPTDPTTTVASAAPPAEDPKPAEPMPETPDPPAKPPEETKPAPPKEPPKPPNPFRTMQPAIDLTSVEGSDVSLGQVLLNKDENLFARLYGGDHAIDNAQTTFQMVDVAGESHSWTISLRGSKVLPGGEGEIATLKLEGKDLNLHFTELAAMEPATRGLANCLLEFTTRTGTHKLKLRTPSTIEPLEVQLAKPGMKVEFEVDNLPDIKMVVIEMVPPGEPLAQHMFQTQSANVDGSLPIILKVGEPTRELLMFEVRPSVRREKITLNAKAFYQIAGMNQPKPFVLREVQQLSQAIIGQNAQLMNQKQILDKNKNSAQAKAALPQIENQLQLMQQAVQQVQLLQELYARLAPAGGKRGEEAPVGNAPALRFRVIYKYTPDNGFGSYDLVIAE